MLLDLPTQFFFETSQKAKQIYKNKIDSNPNVDKFLFSTRLLNFVVCFDPFLPRSIVCIFFDPISHHHILLQWNADICPAIAAVKTYYFFY